MYNLSLRKKYLIMCVANFTAIGKVKVQVEKVEDPATYYEADRKNGFQKH